MQTDIQQEPWRVLGPPRPPRAFVATGATMDDVAEAARHGVFIGALATPGQPTTAELTEAYREVEESLRHLSDPKRGPVRRRR